ncbi:ABC transporter permease [Pseudovibrio ascidiaceicola]|uniref:ABC transporter permease n=1 Tax=Pseudovibrio ascidiaceicola TaxID=285279 RepID=UPI003D36CA78
MATNYREMSAVELLSLEPPGWGGALLDGLVVSLQVALLGYAIGILIGLGGATLKRSGGPVARDLMSVYTTFVRAIPELVLILLAYFALPELLNNVLAGAGFGRIEINGFAAGVLVIGFVQGAYATEVFRGAIASVPVGHIEAAHSFGMHPLRIFRRITLPEMLPAAIPGLSNLWLIATKDTALLAVVGFTELTLAARQASGATKHYFLFLLAAGGLYLMVTLISAQLFKWLENRVSRGTRYA